MLLFRSIALNYLSRLISKTSNSSKSKKLESLATIVVLLGFLSVVILNWHGYMFIGLFIAGLAFLSVVVIMCLPHYDIIYMYSYHMEYSVSIPLAVFVSITLQATEQFLDSQKRRRHQEKK